MRNKEFMASVESRYKQATGLSNRSEYKLFYGPVIAAPILVLGVNPGGDPKTISSDGTTDKGGAVAAASDSFYEDNENDLLDCAWRENAGLLKLLTPLLGYDERRVRTEVVKTNLAFRRSKKKADIDIASAYDESAPFLGEIIGVVQPSLVLLTGVPACEFAKRHLMNTEILVEEEKNSSVNQVVFNAVRADLVATKSEVLVVRIAHASQFSWTYEKYDVISRIQELIDW